MATPSCRTVDHDKEAYRDYHVARARKPWGPFKELRGVHVLCI